MQFNRVRIISLEEFRRETRGKDLTVVDRGGEVKNQGIVGGDPKAKIEAQRWRGK